MHESVAEGNVCYGVRTSILMRRALAVKNQGMREKEKHCHSGPDLAARTRGVSPMLWVAWRGTLTKKKSPVTVETLARVAVASISQRDTTKMGEQRQYRGNSQGGKRFGGPEEGDPDVSMGRHGQTHGGWTMSEVCMRTSWGSVLMVEVGGA